ncbi:MAG TPA: phage head closure protein [Burkholderiales bacterium]|nr:phage head closure protein [Burkholderiales bacterium]
MSVNSYVIRSGDLRHRISFQSRQVGQDAAGQPVDVWTTAFTSWADIAPLNGRALMSAQVMQSAVTHEITMRYRSELASPIAVANMRILFGTRVFNIHASMNQDERNRTVILQAEEGLNDG